ncbi:MAG: hypothetical protein BGO70_01365 [Bacteroidetes bacterium 43-93]|nr:hypothetical protein [Bacteroidota bacterium]OJW96357.1 MAG: hypothetical protein BGO70_01365 [Bacteroidetes bacterium 43-93]
MKWIYGIAAIALLNSQAIFAQEKTNGKKDVQIQLSTDGAKVKVNDKTKPADKDFSVEFGMVDIGVNAFKDNTVYDAQTFANNSFFNVPQDLQNKNLFDLRTGKSINVNIWPVMAKLKLLKTPGQKIYLSTGIGLQIYNFRYSKDITFVNNTVPQVVLLDSTTDYRKNKLVVNYLSIPLQMTFKTRMANKLWLVYGVGITGGYRIGSWTKQVSQKFGKQKNHDSFNLNDFNSCVTAEFGLDDYFRIYASYQLTNMYKDAFVDQRPFSIGLRFGGI